MLSFFPVYKALNDLLFKGSILIKKKKMNKVFECSQLLTSVAMVLPLSMLQSKGYDIVILRAYRLLLYISILLQKIV